MFEPRQRDGYVFSAGSSDTSRRLAIVVSCAGATVETSSRLKQRLVLLHNRQFTNNLRTRVPRYIIVFVKAFLTVALVAPPPDARPAGRPPDDETAPKPRGYSPRPMVK